MARSWIPANSDVTHPCIIPIAGVAGLSLVVLSHCGDEPTTTASTLVETDTEPSYSRTESAYLAVVHAMEDPIASALLDTQILAAGRSACLLYDITPQHENVALNAALESYDKGSPLEGVWGRGERTRDTTARIIGAATHTLCREHADEAQAEKWELLTALN